MFSDYVLAEKLDKIADAIKEARKEGITVGDLYELVQDKESLLIYRNDQYCLVDGEDFNTIVKSINVEDDYILINQYATLQIYTK